MNLDSSPGRRTNRQQNKLNNDKKKSCVPQWRLVFRFQVVIVYNIAKIKISWYFSLDYAPPSRFGLLFSKWVLLHNITIVIIIIKIQWTHSVWPIRVFLLFILLRRTQRIKYNYRYYCYYLPSPNTLRRYCHCYAGVNFYARR